MTSRFPPSWRSEEKKKEPEKEKKPRITGEFPFSRELGEVTSVRNSLRQILEQGQFAIALRETENSR